jgi:hypothetical protein
VNFVQILKALGLRVATMPQYQVVMEVQKLKAEADRLRAEVESLKTTLRFAFSLLFFAATVLGQASHSGRFAEASPPFGLNRIFSCKDTEIICCSTGLNPAF